MLAFQLLFSFIKNKCKKTLYKFFLSPFFQIIICSFVSALLDADHIEEAGKPFIRMWGVDESGKPVCVLAESEPYFYVLPKSAISLK